jgi:hypothetical protein
MARVLRVKFPPRHLSLFAEANFGTVRMRRHHLFDGTRR